MTAVLRIPLEAFGSAVACTGMQVTSVISVIANNVPSLEWFASDVLAVGPWPDVGRDVHPERIGNSAQLASVTSLVEQFESGVLLGCIESTDDPPFPADGVFTEDDLVDLHGAVVIVRMFDTSYVLVSTLDAGVVRAIETAFRAVIIEKSADGH